MEAIFAEIDAENIADETNLLQNLAVPYRVQRGPYEYFSAVKI